MSKDIELANKKLNEIPFQKGEFFKVICMGQLYKVGNWYVGANSKADVQRLSRNRGTEISLDEIEMVSGSLDHIIGSSDNYDDVVNMNDKVERL